MPGQRQCSDDLSRASALVDSVSQGGESGGHSRNQDLQPHLDRCAQAARSAIRATEPEREALTSMLRDFRDLADRVRVEIGTDCPTVIQGVAEAFQEKYSGLRLTVGRLAEEIDRNLREVYAYLEQNADLVTIMLFGRTRAGKSTTMEALTRGPGTSIGTGKQHTTVEFKEYFFPHRPESAKPHGGAALRIVDTPGIEGFDGEALGAMAQRFIPHCDHILFLLTDDKVTEGELAHFNAINLQGKGATVILNVKASDEDLDILVSNPEWVFKEVELDGHARRIRGHLERHFGLSAPRIIYCHARAGWLGRTDAALPAGAFDRHDLLVKSRIQAVEQRIRDFIFEEALPARLRAPRDLLLFQIYAMRRALQPFSKEFQDAMEHMKVLGQRLAAHGEQGRRRALRRFSILRARFRAVHDAIPGLVDEVIVAGARGGHLETVWQQLLRNHGVLDAGAWFVGEARKDFEEELSEDMQLLNAEYQWDMADKVESLLADYETKKRAGRRKRLAASTLIPAATVLADVAITNFWNPVGWVAAAGSILTGVAGMFLAKTVVEQSERSCRVELEAKRRQIITQLRDLAWENHRNVRTACGGWLDEVHKRHVSIVRDVCDPVSRAAGHLWQAAHTCIGEVQKIGDRLGTALVPEVFQAFIPEFAKGSIQIHAIARDPGYRTKVLIGNVERSRVNAMAACIRQGIKTGLLRNALGDHQVHLVDKQAPLERQVIQALGWPQAADCVVCVNSSPERRVASVRPSESQSRVPGARDVRNVRLAEQLLGLQIIVEERVK